MKADAPLAAEFSDPLVADARSVRMLSGLSGASVYLLTEDGRHWIVRKGAIRAEGNERLRRQATKQRRWSEMTETPLRTPRILRDGEIDGRYFFDMEAIRGVDGATFLRTAEYGSIAQFADRVGAHLRSAAHSAPLAEVSISGDFFTALFTRVCDVCRSTKSIDPRRLNVVLLGLDRLRAAGGVAPTLCHGDLTLENLVVDSDGGIWALDLLDSPFEHFWQDVAKLHQDLDGGWYLRHRPAVARCVTEFVGRRLLEETERLTPGYRRLHDVLLACTFIRILPYVRDEASATFVHERIAHYADAVERS